MTPAEFDDDGIVEDDLNEEGPVEETAEEYGYVEPPTNLPPAERADQNPGYSNGAHV